MRMHAYANFDGQLTRPPDAEAWPLWQAHPLPVHLWAAVVPKLYCTGRSLKQTRVQTQM